MRKILFLSLFFLPGGMFAQTGGMITVGEVPAKVQKPSKQERSSRSNVGYGENSLTIGMISFLGGNTPLLYERVIAGPITLQVGAGITSRSFTSIYGEGLLTNNKKEGLIFDKMVGGENITDEYGDYDFRTALPGWSFSVSPRVYFGDDALDGRFIGILAEYRKYRWAAQTLDPNVSSSSYEYYGDFTTNTQKESQEGIDLSLVFGLHQQYVRHVCISYVLGTGMRFSKSTRQDLGYVRDASNGGHYLNESVEFNNRRLLFTFQVNVGGWW